MIDRLAEAVRLVPRQLVHEGVRQRVYGVAASPAVREAPGDGRSGEDHH
jgi:hypothetical protein